MIDVVMPQMGESIVEGTLTKWLKKAGEHVERDEPLFEISTDKVDTEIPAPAAGVLKEVLVEEGKTVAISTVVGRIEEGAGNGASAPAQAAAPAPAAAKPAAVPSPAKAPSEDTRSKNRSLRKSARNPWPAPLVRIRSRLRNHSRPCRPRMVRSRRWSAKWRASMASIFAR